MVAEERKNYQFVLSIFAVRRLYSQILMLNTGIHLYRKPSIRPASILFQFCKKETGEVVDLTRLHFIEILHSLITRTGIGLIDKKIRLFQQFILQLCIELLGYMRSQYLNYLGYLVEF